MLLTEYSSVQSREERVICVSEIKKKSTKVGGGCIDNCFLQSTESRIDRRGQKEENRRRELCRYFLLGEYRVQSPEPRAEGDMGIRDKKTKRYGVSCIDKRGKKTERVVSIRTSCKVSPASRVEGRD